MYRAAPILCVVVLVASALEIRSQEPAGDRAAAALQAQVQCAIERAEPSIACILVSRSQEYRHFGSAPTDEASGKLGRFDARTALIGTTDRDERRRTVVNLDLSSPDHIPESYGSGVVIDESGLILTCAHVVRNATKVFVRLPGGRGSWADIHASDPRSDLAVVRLLDRVSDLKAIPFGDGGAVKKGQFVIGMANPFAAGFRDGSPSASWGIISNLRRRASRGRPMRSSFALGATADIAQLGVLLQTDVRLNLGSSGGALLDLRGELIGLTTAQAALSGSETPGGFAVPFDAALRRIVEKLRRGEEVEYGFLGISLPPDTRGTGGVQLSADPLPGSPAHRAGMQRGDTIVAINGTPVRDMDELFLQIGINLAGSKIRVEAGLLAANSRVYEAKLAKFNVPGPVIASKRPPAWGGLRVDYTSVLSQREGALPWQPGIPEGVAIREVVPGSPADQKQLQPDKIVTRVNNKSVTTPDEYYQEVEKSPLRFTLTFLKSEGGEDSVTLEPRKR